MMNYNKLCKECGGYPGQCVCGHKPQPDGRLEDISMMKVVSEAANVECLAPATLLSNDDSREVVITKTLTVLDLASKRYSKIDHDELLPDGNTELGDRYSLELSSEDAERLKIHLEAIGWRVGHGRQRRRNDILDRLNMIADASAAIGGPCIAAIDIVDDSGEAFGTAIVEQSDTGTLRLLDELDHSEMPCEGLLVYLLPDDQTLSDDLQDAGYVVYGTPPKAPKRITGQVTYSIRDSCGGGMLIKMMSRTDTCKGNNQSGPYIPKRFAKNLGLLELNATETRSRTMDMRIMIGNQCLGEQEVHYRWEHNKGEYRMTCLGSMLREHAEEGDIFTIDLATQTFRLVRRRQDADWGDLMNTIGISTVSFG